MWQLLRSLRLERAASRQRHNRGNKVGSFRRGRGGGRVGGRGSFLHSSGSRGRPFSPPDDWDDTGIFTVALRPKTVPSGSAGRQQHQQHAFVTPSIGRSAASRLVPPPIVGRPVTSVGGVKPSSDEIRNGLDNGGESGITPSDGFNIWNKRRRKVRGEGYDSSPVMETVYSSLTPRACLEDVTRCGCTSD